MMLSAATSTISVRIDEHHVGFDREHVEEALVELAPVGVDHRPLLDVRDLVAHRVDMVGIVDIDLDHVGLAVAG